MKYIKVTNKTENVNRLRLEKLGFSSKRDVEETIGQFGSGIKFAPIAAIRKGMEFVFSGNDDKGSYNLSYIIKDDEGIPSVYYKYDDYEKPSSFTADAGLLSWESDFQIYREIVANAIDESKITGEPWDISIVDVDKIEAIDGEFSVYITATEEMIDINNNFDKYFSVNRVPIWEKFGVKIYKPIDNRFRAYCKGVLVYVDKDMDTDGNYLSGFFDYEFSNLTLNEERTLKNFYELKYFIANNVFSYIDDEEICKYIIDSFMKIEEDHTINNYFEACEITSYTYANASKNELMRTTFEKMLPKTIAENARSCSYNFMLTAKSKGYNVVKIESESILAFLQSHSIPSFKEIFGDFFSHEVKMGMKNYPSLQLAFQIVKDILPDISEIEDVVGIYFDDEDKATLAITSMMKLDEEDSIPKKILFNHQHAENSSVKELISTFIHEWDHYRTGIGDGDDTGRGFRDIADKTISELVYRLWISQNKEASK
jgi:hypothetical protein